MLAMSMMMMMVVVLVMFANGMVPAYGGVTSSYVRPPVRGLVPMGLRTKGSSEPTQVHVSLAGPRHMQVSWVTSCFGTLSIVEYGTEPGSYTMSEIGSSTSYSYVLYKSGEIHSVVLGPLEDSTTYYYRCGHVNSEFSFKTPPPLGPDVPIDFAIVGDLGQTIWSQSTLEHIKRKDHDVLLFAGDLSYADYYQPLWDSFGKLVSPLASTRPWMVTEGNHDVEYIPIFIESFRAYNLRWPMPYKESGSTSNLYYSFEVAGVHLIMLGSYTDYSIGSDQYTWLQADLASVDRSKTPWLIVVLHAPWYNSNYDHQGDGNDMMVAMEPLLYEAEVDLLFSGHVHAYERSTRVYMGEPDPCGIIHINIGDGGNREGLASRYIKPQPVWSLFREASFGHGELNVHNSTHLLWTWHRNNDDEAFVADQLWFDKFSHLKEGKDIKYTCNASKMSAAKGKELR